MKTVLLILLVVCLGVFALVAPAYHAKWQDEQKSYTDTMVLSEKEGIKTLKTLKTLYDKDFHVTGFQTCYILEDTYTGKELSRKCNR